MWGAGAVGFSVGAVGLLLMLAWVRPSYAQTDPHPERGAAGKSVGSCAAAELSAEVLTQHGNAGMLDARYADALQCYERAYAITGDPRHLYNTARALDFLRRPVKAFSRLRQFSREANSELKSRVPQLPDLLQEYRSRVGLIELVGPRDGASVSINGVELGITPFPEALVVRPGTAQLLVRAASEGTFETKLQVRPNQLLRVDVVMQQPPATDRVGVGAARPASGATGLATPTAAVQNTEPNTLRTVAWGSLAFSVVAGGLAATSYGLALASFDEACRGEGVSYRPTCDPGEVDEKAQDRFETWGGVYVGSLIAAGAGLATFGVLYWHSSDSSSEEAGGAGGPPLQLSVAPGRVTLQGSF